MTVVTTRIFNFVMVATAPLKYRIFRNYEMSIASFIMGTGVSALFFGGVVTFHTEI